MDCRRARKALMEYSEGGLSKAGRRDIGEHLEACDDCRALSDKLDLSAAALGGLQPVEMPEEASKRVLTAIKSGRVAAPSGGGFFSSPRTLAAAGAVTAVLVALAIVVGIVTGGKPARKEQVLRSSVPAQTASTQGAAEDAAGQKDLEGMTNAPAASLVLPVARATSNNYDQDSIKSMAESCEVKDKFAERYSLSDAINLRVAFIQKLADEFVAVGGDGPMLEAMISYVQSSEPVLLPCYAEQALFSNEDVIIIGLSGPPRGGTSKMLTRTEFWAMNPARFVANPDTCLVWWGQSSR